MKGSTAWLGSETGTNARKWTDEWSAMCDDDCPDCGARHMSPYESDDLTEVIEEREGKFIALRSPESAGDSPDYQEIAVICELPPARPSR